MSPFAFAIAEPDPLIFHNDDDRFFFQALQSAQACMGTTHPNPSVGAVLVKDGKMIAHGHTHPVGGMHAEKHAISNANVDLKGASIYVTLEPCSHFGRTPPCTDAIIEAGISRVVFGVEDPNPMVDGRGVKQLQKAGIDVSLIKNLKLLAMAQAQILPFVTWIKKQRPYVVLKIATSLDDKIALYGQRSKITGRSSDVVVHQLRRAIDAVMIGANTARIDDPLLSARFAKKNHGQEPARVVLSTDLNLDDNLRIMDTSHTKTLLFTSAKAPEKKRAHLKERGLALIDCSLLDNKLNLTEVLSKLAKEGISSLLVEAGQKLFLEMISRALADEVWWFRSDVVLGEGALGLPPPRASCLEQGYQELHKCRLGDDELTIFKK